MTKSSEDPAMPSPPAFNDEKGDPPQPVFSDGPPVPLMVEGVMDDGLLAQYLSELMSHAEVLEIQDKSLATSHAAPTSAGLFDAVARLKVGATRAVQVRYDYHGFQWADTLLGAPVGFRLVRCRLEN